MQRTFQTPTPITLYVEIGSGDVRVEAADVDTTDVEVTGHGEEHVRVEQRDDTVEVVAPPRGGGLFGAPPAVHVRVRLPRASRLQTKLGSADLSTTGPLGDVNLKTGSGTVRLETVDGEGVVKTGSGDVAVQAVTGELSATTGSGTVELGELGGRAEVTSGSGDVRVRSAAGELAVKTGSGDLEILDVGGDTALRTGSGTVVVGRVRRGQLVAKTGSGDIRVGVPAGVPVWTDITTGTGKVRSDLHGVGEPAEGQEFVKLLARTGSGSVHLEQL
jgi:DUF4097 and DUF4098 domain-containing protein YvlB